MNRSRLTTQLRHDEGSVASVYKDSEGYYTIGVGRLVDEKKGGKLSEDEIEYLLDNDIDRVVNQAIREFTWYNDLNDVRQEAVLNMIFNLGLTGFKGFKLAIKAFERHDFDEAAKQLLDSKWSRQVGARATRIADAVRVGEWT